MSRPGPKPSPICRRGHDRRLTGKTRAGQCCACISITWKARQSRLKLQLADYKRARCCTVCGYNRSVAALHFHHRDPSAKAFSIGLATGKHSSWATILREIEKCDLLCANCHIELHSSEEIPKSVIKVGGKVIA